MKIIAFYLPQFHRIPENDKWWGEGFTEWVNVKKAKKFFPWQRQPRTPLNENYYNLLDASVQEYQSQIAKKYGIYGFCYYHYWFDGHMLLEKPMENMLANKKIDTPFCICWANEDWTNAWVSDNAKILISQTYGDEQEWERHYRYLSAFFKDPRYIKEDNKPLFVIYRPEIIPCLEKMIKSWNKFAKNDGFDGIKFAHQNSGLDFPIKKDDSLFDYDIEMQPAYAKLVDSGERNNVRKNKIHVFLKRLHLSWIVRVFKKVNGPAVFDYDHIWSVAIKTPPISEKSVPCAFVDFDNTCRRQRQGWLFKGASVKKFEHYFNEYYKKASTQYKNDFMFIFAWNEWAEGGYLEPDTDNEFGYLEAIKKTIDSNK